MNSMSIHFSGFGGPASLALSIAVALLIAVNPVLAGGTTVIDLTYASPVPRPPTAKSTTSTTSMVGSRNRCAASTASPPGTSPTISDEEEPWRHGGDRATPRKWILGAIGMGPYQQITQ